MNYTLLTQAIALSGKTVAVQLIGGQSLTGTLAYAQRPTSWGGFEYPEVLTLTTSGKATTVRADHVSAIGES
ncbi:predicted protein [Streptomyces sp. SPB78]|uniref:hypothetical protein n=1 Tax=Streptomyces sp. (strain SPB78) TaxID=591157 RepID=UPI0001B553AC|nr:hypothetical protein [Streptomyces sp. SPB78]EFK99538.1 predicted protein [Streptomyces sp. SPB78]